MTAHIALIKFPTRSYGISLYFGIGTSEVISPDTNIFVIKEADNKQQHCQKLTNILFHECKIFLEIRRFCTGFDQ